jgi:DHA2 family multidrug resistance protein-like MFS transporter
MPMMVAAAAFAPVAGGLTAKIGPRKVIARGLVLMAAGSSLLILLAPETPYGQVLLALVLLGAGDIAVVTPVADVILSAVPRERTGSAAALNGAAIQIGGALGTAVLTSVLTAVARAAYYQRLEPSGLSRQEIAAATEALRQSIQKGRREAAWPSLKWCAPNLPMPTGMRSRWAPEGCSPAQRLFPSFARCLFGLV